LITANNHHPFDYLSRAWTSPEPEPLDTEETNCNSSQFKNFKHIWAFMRTLVEILSKERVDSHGYLTIPSQLQKLQSIKWEDECE